MVNSECGAVMFGAACVLSAVQANAQPKHPRWLIITILTACAAILCKDTAIASVIAATWILVWHPGHQRYVRGFLVGGTAAAMATLWSLFLYYQYGTMLPSPYYKPLFTGGPQALLLFPDQALFFGFILATHMAIGLAVPQWLQQSGHMYRYLAGECTATCYSYVYCIYLLGILITAWLFVTARRYNKFTFIIPCYLSVFFIVLNNMYFRDSDIIYAPARYLPVAAVFVAILAASRFTYYSTAMKRIFASAYIALVALQFLIVFQFFNTG